MDAIYWWLTVAGAIIVLWIAAIVAHIREIRKWPKCPVHGKTMVLFGEMQYEEFVCPVLGCKQCADVHQDGTVHYFNT